MGTGPIMCTASWIRGFHPLMRIVICITLCTVTLTMSAISSSGRRGMGSIISIRIVGAWIAILSWGRAKGELVLTRLSSPLCWLEKGAFCIILRRGLALAFLGFSQEFSIPLPLPD